MEYQEALGDPASKRWVDELPTVEFDDAHPGPCIHDVKVLLNFVSSRQLEAAGKLRLLPMNILTELNGLMLRPLPLKMTRPQLRSYPNLEAVYLMVRASGLVTVQQTGSKMHLAVNAAVVDAWQALNSTEKYFALLEAVLRLAEDSMIGERSGMGTIGIASYRTWQALRHTHTRFDEPKAVNDSFYGLLPLSILDAFGVVTLESWPAVAGRRWGPSVVHRNSFGDGLMRLLYPLLDPIGTFGDLSLGTWQEAFQLHFPEWRRNLTIPKAPFRDGTYVFKVSLGKIWRRIAISAQDTLEDLSDAILRAVGFDDDHLYSFALQDELGRTSDAVGPESDDGPAAGDVRIGDLILAVGELMPYIYDFGDCWKFDVRLERIDPPDKAMKKPRLIAKEGKAPEQYPNWDG